MDNFTDGLSRVVNGAIIEDERLLVVRKKKGNVYILPGGKPKKDEDPIHCLEREFSEELNGTRVAATEYYKPFFGISPNRSKKTVAYVYFTSSWVDITKTSGEVDGFKWITSEDLSNQNINISDITRKIIESLKYNNYIK